MHGACQDRDVGLWVSMLSEVFGILLELIYYILANIFLQSVRLTVVILRVLTTYVRVKITLLSTKPERQ